jgi:hypothetical protein
MAKYKKVYIAGVLTVADRDQRNFYKQISLLCDGLGAESYVPHIWGTDPIANPDIKANEIWKINQRQVNNSDLVIAYVGQPSLGVGAELEMARVNSTKIILWWFKGEKVSRMALGNPLVIKKLEINTQQELFSELKKILKK